MGGKIKSLENLIDEVKEKLTKIQNERSEDNLKRIIKIKNEDISKILDIKTQILDLNSEDDDLLAYQNDGFEAKIAEVATLCDQTFAVVEQMKRETEESYENDDDVFSIGPSKTNEVLMSKERGSNGYVDSDGVLSATSEGDIKSEVVIEDTRSNNDYIQEIFAKPLKKALASVIMHQPNDPIAYLASYLHYYRQNELLDKQS